jgi:hypothetical protein
MRYINDPVHGIIPSKDGKGMTRAQAMKHLLDQMSMEAQRESLAMLEGLKVSMQIDAAIARGDDAEAEYLKSTLND